MRKVAIVGGCRTPFVKAGGALGRASFLDLGIHVVTKAIEKLQLDVDKVDEVIFGTVLLDPRIPNAAREIVLRSGLPKRVGGHFVSNNCVTGLLAASAAVDGIVSGRISCVLAGGSESMSRPALTLHPKAEAFFLKLARSKGLMNKVRSLAAYRPRYAVPLAPSPKEPSTGLTMGQHCELMAKEFNISRDLQDQIAFRSHQTAAKAQNSGVLAEEIVPFEGVEKDNLIRPDTSLDRLGKLPAVFDRSPAGTISAGNSSALTDGASVVCLMAEEEAKRQGKHVIAYLEAIEFAGIDPKDGLLMGPALAVPKLLKRTGIGFGEIDLFEIHEAFGAQVAANLQVWEHGWGKFPDLPRLGRIESEKINVNGGSIAIGHPFAATGGRILLSAARELERRNQKRALVSICAAGAMAGAALITR
ncbi:MAG: acetyl-CoA C-acyltransferase [Deltaproteobacteria bacterium]|nr:acetyl-CoA C-acyltransferase [Deltaproteobacteria bacterium]